MEPLLFVAKLFTLLFNKTDETEEEDNDSADHHFLGNPMFAEEEEVEDSLEGGQ